MRFPKIEHINTKIPINVNLHVLSGNISNKKNKNYNY